MRRQARRDEPQIDPIEQRTESFCRYASTRCGGHRHWALLIALEPARARVRGGDEREARRELDLSGHPRDHDPPVLDRLPKRLDGVAPELGELVEEEVAVVREG
jgi:hypothetical protein